MVTHAREAVGSPGTKEVVGVATSATMLASALVYALKEVGLGPHHRACYMPYCFTHATTLFFFLPSCEGHQYGVTAKDWEDWWSMWGG